MMRRLSLLVPVVVLMTACAGRNEEPVARTGEEISFSVREGDRLFSHYCAPCHGEPGDGFGRYYAFGLDPQPADFTAADFLAVRKDSLLSLAITESSAALGKSNLCPPWGNTLSSEEIEQLVSHIMRLNETANPAGAEEDSTANQPGSSPGQ
jgi:mono/diheme cytochrome c family protein